MYKQIEEYNLAKGVKFKIFKHIDAGVYVVISDHYIDFNCTSLYGDVLPARVVSQPMSYVKAYDVIKNVTALMGQLSVHDTFGKQEIINGIKDKKKQRTPVLYTDFSKMDPNDPLIKAMEKRRPYRSSDFTPRHMIPDLRPGHIHC